ncbi:1-acyl-sn-glycerol-3-phosphate acyltransferase [Jatrophihabitans telluris]|uniref:1-acyl-sn-glycerol-3-phosphate acyltransferase n=1 Tax=Jatrophihabitans telluris TaxID=2038343 RepID=A0ABY4QW94_9ACTN|nr:lysophospholipid acyltransferase family protein [Jatrophihabitans telluris]UQX87372.1 1-acyl-sn-glycerol-3-phosphate acyltransferase [Jatrophihabitans telluris]
MAVSVPVVRWWGRLDVVGLDVLPRTGPCLLIANHDSHWDPLIIGVAAQSRRPVRALAKSSLWERPVLAWILTRMGQLPITRGVADRRELSSVLAALRSGGCVGVFPEGTLSRGRTIRAYSGAGWIAGEVRGAAVVGVRVTGSVSIVRFPVRPRIRVEFFRPIRSDRAGYPNSISYSRRILAEIRRDAPPVAAGRGEAASAIVGRGRPMRSVKKTGAIAPRRASPGRMKTVM